MLHAGGGVIRDVSASRYGELRDRRGPVVLFLFVAYRFDLYCVRDLAEADVSYYSTPQVWTDIITFATPLGGITYLTVGRSRRSRL